MMDELLEQFLIEARDLIVQADDDLSGLARDPQDAARIDSAFRAVHTLKGSVAIFDMAPAGRALHVAEDVLEQARAGRQPLEPAAIAALVALMDQTDRWVDAMERDGALPASAEDDAEALMLRLLARAPLQKTAATPTPSWFDALRVRESDVLESAENALIAFRYAPDSECFFRGDDPLATVSQVPGIVALAVLPVQPWPALAEFEPFQCAIVVEGLSDASEGDIRAAFRLVADQLELVPFIRDRQAAESPIMAPVLARSLRVEVGRVDALADGVGELIVANNILAHLANEADRIDTHFAARLREAHMGLERAVADMREAVTAVRMVSLGPTLQRLPRMVREIAEAVGKAVTFGISGETTEVDKGIADQLFEPLLHIIRNAIDHGVEDEDARQAAGKPEAGMLRLDIERDGDQVVIAVADDGAGIDVARVRATAVRRGLLQADAADLLDDAQVMRLIFAPGFSTADAVTAISGRGVGMDAVREAVERLGGRVDISSAAGEGTTIRLRMPLNAIMTRLLIVRAGGERYGVPLDRIVETVNLSSDRILSVGTGRACVIRNRTLPILNLSTLLGNADTPTPTTKLLVTETGTERVAVVVDGFGERFDGLVRPRSGLLASVPGISGTTMMGDGGVLLVLDLAELVA